MRRFELSAYDGKKISVVEWGVESPIGIILISYYIATDIKPGTAYRFFAKQMEI